MIGCGTGNYLVALSEFVGKVIGLELNEGMLEKARKKTAHLKNIDVMQGDITDMPFPDGHFDAICCNMVSMSVILLCVQIKQILKLIMGNFEGSIFTNK